MAITKKSKVTSVVKDVEKSEFLYTDGGNVSWYSHCGKWCGGSSKKLKIKKPLK